VGSRYRPGAAISRRTLAAMKRAVSAVLLSLVLLGGCGDEGDDTANDPGTSESTTETPSAETSAPTEPSPSDSEIVPTETTAPLPDWPACAEVWVADSTLPGDYQGCVADGTAVKAKNRFCEFGKKLVTYADQFWAVRGGTVNDAGGPLTDSADYRGDLESCRG
jgi:hypothetical protein